MPLFLFEFLNPWFWSTVLWVASYGGRFYKGVDVLYENCDVIDGLVHFCGLGRVLKCILDCKFIWWL